jgi:hypothetical protein
MLKHTHREEGVQKKGGEKEAYKAFLRKKNPEGSDFPPRVGEITK